MLKKQEIGLRSREGRNIQLSDCETRDADIKKQVPKIDSFSSQTLSVNSALLTQFHLERYNCRRGTVNDAKKYGIFFPVILPCLLRWLRETWLPFRSYFCRNKPECNFDWKFRLAGKDSAFEGRRKRACEKLIAWPKSRITLIAYFIIWSFF